MCRNTSANLSQIINCKDGWKQGRITRLRFTAVLRQPSMDLSWKNAALAVKSSVDRVRFLTGGSVRQTVFKAFKAGKKHCHLASHAVLHCLEPLCHSHSACTLFCVYFHFSCSPHQTEILRSPSLVQKSELSIFYTLWFCKSTALPPCTRPEITCDMPQFCKMSRQIESAAHRHLPSNFWMVFIIFTVASCVKFMLSALLFCIFSHVQMFH